MKFKFNMKRELKIVAAVLIVAVIIAFTERRQGDVSINDITIKDEKTSRRIIFWMRQDIIDLMELKKDNLKGASIDRVNLKGIEKKISKQPFIKDAIVQ